MHADLEHSDTTSESTVNDFYTLAANLHVVKLEISGLPQDETEQKMRGLPRFN